MHAILENIVQSKRRGEKHLAILLDPDKIDWERLPMLADRIASSPATYLLVGGSQVNEGDTDKLVRLLKAHCTLPIVLFPGHPSQITPAADGILLLSLLSGRNPDYLIGHHVAAAQRLRRSKLEIIPTGYILVESGTRTAVSRISQTEPLDRDDVDAIVSTAIAGEMLGLKMIYLEAGSGARDAVSPHTVAAVSMAVDLPIVVGGGIRSRQGIDAAFAAGADWVVIGTAFEHDPHFFEPVAQLKTKS